MESVRDGESKPAVGGAPGDADEHDGAGDMLQAPARAPWAAGEGDELTLRDKPTSVRRLFTKSLTKVAALVTLSLGLTTAEVIGDRKMQKNLDEAAAEQAEAETKADLAEARRREAVVEKFLAQQVQTAATAEERGRAEKALADWRKNHPGLAPNALQAEAGQ